MGKNVFFKGVYYVPEDILDKRFWENIVFGLVSSEVASFDEFEGDEAVFGVVGDFFHNVHQLDKACLPFELPQYLALVPEPSTQLLVVFESLSRICCYPFDGHSDSLVFSLVDSDFGRLTENLCLVVVEPLV